ncbi:hypothetical protein GCM10009677_04500 [Sphaerisporangium rubeum]|uniref:Uncharacterized protein n=1 Tax=Sphaerisporangium rubeum TaxID=321317 RepID=A0A7X0I916_9ACTN|nr:hypothetical protein [Sphaerisporangium rubeum]MBB6470710.1 hypothetical protein [Sphaerisporangium rubeum]
MDRDGTPRNHDEDPINQTGPLGMEWRDETDPPGDVLSDDWRDGHESGATVVADGIVSTGERYHLDVPGDPGRVAEDHGDDLGPEGHDGDWPGPDDTDAEDRRGFLGSGWRGDDGSEDEEGPNQNRRLILAMLAVVVLAVAGGWIVSSSASPAPEATCTAADCGATPPPVPGPTDDTEPDATTPPAVDPELTPEPTPSAPSGTPAAVPSGTRSQSAPDPTTAEPEPTRTRDRPADPPRSSAPPRDEREPRVEEEPTPTPPPSTSPPPPPTTKPPAPTPTEKERDGLLDWLF